jgi:hypothetical protein
MIMVMMAAVLFFVVDANAQSGVLFSVPHVPPSVAPAKRWQGPRKQMTDALMNCSAMQVVQHKRRVHIEVAPPLIVGS